MIKWYRSKSILAREKKIARATVDSMIKRWEVIELVVDRTKRANAKWEYKELKPFNVYILTKDLG